MVKFGSSFTSLVSSVDMTGSETTREDGRSEGRYDWRNELLEDMNSDGREGFLGNLTACSKPNFLGWSCKPDVPSIACSVKTGRWWVCSLNGCNFSTEGSSSETTSGAMLPACGGPDGDDPQWQPPTCQQV